MHWTRCETRNMSDWLHSKFGKPLTRSHPKEDDENIAHPSCRGVTVEVSMLVVCAIRAGKIFQLYGC